MGNTCTKSTRVYPTRIIAVTETNLSSPAGSEIPELISHVDLEQQSNDGKSTLHHQQYSDFQQQYYNGRSSLQLNQQLDFQQQVYSDTSRPSSVKPRQPVGDGYPDSDILMVVQFSKHIETLLKQTFRAEGNNLCTTNTCYNKSIGILSANYVASIYTHIKVCNGKCGVEWMPYNRVHICIAMHVLRLLYIHVIQ